MKGEAMPGRKTLLGGAALAAVLLVSGCTGAPAGGGSPAPPGAGGGAQAAPADPSVQWATSVCDAIAPAGTLGKKIAAIDGTGPESIAKVLDTASSALTASTAALKGVGTSPIEGADVIIGDVAHTLDTTATGIAGARAKLAAGDESVAPGAMTTLATGLESLTRITDAPSGSPLALATAKAPSCRPLTGG
jgi:hypothetical protein